jgi:predicted NBD/HSP70 family sugar kinase
MNKESRTPVIVGVDLGVTHYRVGVVEAGNGKVHTLRVANTAGLSLDTFCDSLARIVRPWREQVEGVGVAVPGFCDHGQQRVVTTYGTVPFLESCALAKAV